MSITAESAPQSANQPIRFRRDPNTGLVEGVAYKYTSDGQIDWRAMVPTKFLYVAKEHEEKVIRQQGKPLAEIDLLAVKDDWLRVRVGGLNHILHLRGVRSVRYPIMQNREGFSSVVCEIELIPNVESNMQPETWSGIASACRASMDLRMLPYLETFAENRAFSRAIKRALQINILSDIEVGGDGRSAVEGSSVSNLATDAEKEAAVGAQSAPSGFQPYDELKRRCVGFKDSKGQARPISFEELKAAAIRINTESAPDAKERIQSDPSQWTDFSSIQPIDAWLLIGRIDAKQKEAAAPEKASGKKAK